MDSYRINFKNWRIVDIDNFMEGNPYFSKIKEESVWEKDVINICGGEHAKTNYLTDTGPAPEIGLNIAQKDVREYARLARRVAHSTQELDTRSNRVMSPLHKRRDDMALFRDN